MKAIFILLSLFFFFLRISSDHGIGGELLRQSAADGIISRVKSRFPHAIAQSAAPPKKDDVISLKWYENVTFSATYQFRQR